CYACPTCSTPPPPRPRRGTSPWAPRGRGRPAAGRTRAGCPRYRGCPADRPGLPFSRGESVSVLDTAAPRPAGAQRGPDGVPSLQLNLAGKEPDQAVPQLIEHAARLHVSDLFFNTNDDSVEVAARHLGILRKLS